MLSKWWTNGTRDDVFWRSSNSGGRATTRAKQGKATTSQTGDITYTDAIGKPLIDTITFEIKRGYSSSTIHDLLDAAPQSAKQTYEAWFDQVMSAAQRGGSWTWALITRRDRRVPLIFMPAVSFSQLYMLSKTYTRYAEHTHEMIYVSLPENKERVTGCHLSWWLDNITPKAIIEYQQLMTEADVGDVQETNGLGT